MVFQPQNTQPQNFFGQPQNRKIFRAVRSSFCSRVDQILRHAPDAYDFIDVAKGEVIGLLH